LGIRGLFTPFLGGRTSVSSDRSEADWMPDGVKRYLNRHPHIMDNKSKVPQPNMLNIVKTDNKRQILSDPPSLA